MALSRIALPLLLGLFLTLGSQPASADWQSSAPVTGPITSIASDGTYLYVATDTSGVFRSADHGVTWEAANEGLPDKGIIAVRSSGSMLYAAMKNGFGGAIFLSSNHGTTWVAPASPYFGYVFCLETTGTSMLAGTWYGVARSTDEGATWPTLSTTGLPSNAGVAAIATSGSSIWAAVSTSSTGGTGVFLSTNNGTRWTAKNTGFGNALPTALALTPTAVFTGTGAGLYRTLDNGAHWSRVEGAPATTPITSLVVAGSTIFAATSAGMYSSSDNGATWTDIGSNLPTGTVARTVAVVGNELMVGTTDALLHRSLGEVAAVSSGAQISEPVHIWPNPAHKTVHMRVDPEGTTDLNSITLTDVLGNRVPVHVAYDGEHGITVELGELPRGTYFLSMQCGNKRNTQTIAIN